MKTAHLFPAFVPEYLGIEPEVIQSFGIDIQSYFEKASKITGTDLTHFNIVENNFQDQPLGSQYVAYIFSCCVSDLLHQQKNIPDYVIYYSMGIYAALYHCRSIDFSTGLHMIYEAYNCIERNLPVEKSGMCAIGGLSFNDINTLIKPYRNEIFIINQNSEFSFLLSGNQSKLKQTLDAAAIEGAMQVRMLPVSQPYHTSLLKNAAAEFSKALLKMKINDPVFSYISSMDQRIITCKQEIVDELISNLYKGFNWWKTVTFLLQNQTHLLIECGAGESLYKIGKFIDGDFQILNLKKLKLFLER